ncbi:MAG: DUF1688 family protein [Deltaproteobacteria bacterium]|nr:MAG: DUF1688 family protein [Deltaproteobacteria bacterium]
MKTQASPTLSSDVSTLLSPATIRNRAHHLLQLAEENKLSHWQVNQDPWDEVVEFVANHIQANYPDLNIPYHSRIRHFDAGEVSRSSDFARRIGHFTPLEQGLAWYDLIILSVLLDAGAGPHWSYLEHHTETRYNRSEGLAVASYRMFLDGLFSADPEQPLRADASRLVTLTVEEVADAMQVSESNPMIGLEGRVALLQSLGQCVLDKAEDFGNTGRPGGLFATLWKEVELNTLPAKTILRSVLLSLGDIWPGRFVMDGVNLGDVWQHSAMQTEDATSGYVPFHKLSQWLTYSLLEPLEFADVTVTHLDDLTGLAEYRNGGLFMDFGVLVLQDPGNAEKEHSTDSELVVEWRALTIALLDRIADDVRNRLGLSAAEFPLAKVLQGGTWSAGRVIAKKKRSDGSPPLSIARDGTVF